MSIPNAVKQVMADAWKNYANFVAVFTGAGGGTTGANEATGGGYARQATTWTSNTNGTVGGSAVTVPVAAATYTEGGLFSASTAGNFGGSVPFSGGSVIVSGSGASIVVTPNLAVA